MCFGGRLALVRTTPHAESGAFDAAWSLTIAGAGPGEVSTFASPFSVVSATVSSDNSTSVSH